jgi:hypothetical protein
MTGTVIIKPLGRSVSYIYFIGYQKGYLGLEVCKSISRDDRIKRLDLMDLAGSIGKDPLGSNSRRFYISLGLHLLDRSFVLNSSSISIY